MKAKEAAQALYQATVGKSAEEMRTITKRLVAHLGDAQRTSLLPAILTEYQRIEFQKSGVTVTVASKKEAERLSQEIDAIVAKIATAESAVVTKEDATLVSGFIVEGKGKRFDHSGKSSLVALYHQLTA